MEQKRDLKSLRFDAALMAELYRYGFANPHDPGYGPDTWNHFVLDPNAERGVRCTVHGAVGK